MISLKLSRIRRKGALVVYTPNPSLNDELLAGTEHILSTVARWHFHLHWLVRVYAKNDGSMSQAQRQLLQRHIRNIEINRFTDTIVIAGTETSMFTELIMWNAARLNIPVWNFSDPYEGDLYRVWEVFCEQKIF
jgi:hypothetical protein